MFHILSCRAVGFGNVARTETSGDRSRPVGRGGNVRATALIGGAVLMLSRMIGGAEAQLVGNTNYLAPPFQSQVYQQCWGCSGGLDPTELFFTANPKSNFLNATLMAQVRQNAAEMTKAGLVPASGAQRWEDTWEAAQPASLFPGEPQWIANDRANNGGTPLDLQPEFVAWSEFIRDRPQYWDYAFDGGTMPNQANYFRSWGSQWGHISPLTPLFPVDCPSDMKAGCTWGDEWAYRWARTSAVTGGYGITLSDGTDGQPTYPSFLHDFNPRIVAGFALKYGFSSELTRLSTPQVADWINAHAFPLWQDYLSIGYGHYYGALAARIGAATGHRALVIDQCSVTPSFRRFSGTDQRIFLRQMNVQDYLCEWDNQSIQVGRAGPIASPPMQELAGAVMAAARTPWVRNGANLEADDAAYWSAIASFYPQLNQSQQKAVGYHLLKRLWLWEAWAHIADHTGLVRRALALYSRDYWDVGTLTALNPLTTLIETIRPAAPIGPAVYYSVPVERAIEATEPQAGQALQPYMQWPAVQQFIDGGGGFDYFVSDAALPAISRSAGNAPSAWVVLDTRGLMRPAELRALQAIAPVVTTPQQLVALPNQPFQLSGGLTGFGFYDQNRRIIAVISNPSTLPNAKSLGGNLKLTGLAAGTYQATDLFINHSANFTTQNGTLVVPVAVNPWDTEVLAITRN